MKPAQVEALAREIEMVKVMLTKLKDAKSQLPVPVRVGGDVESTPLRQQERTQERVQMRAVEQIEQFTGHKIQEGDSDMFTDVEEQLVYEGAGDEQFSHGGNCYSFDVCDHTARDVMCEAVAEHIMCHSPVEVLQARDHDVEVVKAIQQEQLKQHTAECVRADRRADRRCTSAAECRGDFDSGGARFSKMGAAPRC